MAFYTGPGVLNFDGKDYAFGEQLPTGVPSETIKALKASGKAADAAPATAKSAAASELGILRDQVQALKAELTNAREAADDGTAEIERLRDAVTAARESLEQAQNTIKEMSAAQLSGLQPTAPPAPPVTGAGPRK